METHAPLQRHPKCSALYATFRHESAAAKSVEPNVAYLANVTVEVTTKTLTRGASTFALTVHDRKSSSTWRHLRSYADCRAFQSRVLQVLSRGHLCFAECPWLFTYVQRALPAERTGHHLFRVAGRGPKPRVVEKQRQALARLVATLQRVLLNPLNQKCSVLLRQVAPEVMTFITNRSDGDGHEALHSPSSDRPLAKTFSESFMFAVDESEKSAQSSTTTVAEEVDEQVAVQTVDKVVAGQRVCCAMCALHKMRSDEQVFACWRAETMSSRLMRLRAGAGAERTSLVAKRQSSTHSASTHAKSAWASPSYSQRETSPLEPLAVLGGARLGGACDGRNGPRRNPDGPFSRLARDPPRLDRVLVRRLVRLRDRLGAAGHLATVDCREDVSAVGRLGGRKLPSLAALLALRVELDPQQVRDLEAARRRPYLSVWRTTHILETMNPKSFVYELSPFPEHAISH
ncbi:hypothetical protein PRIC1_004205 [Phytophthora ramorum]